jgi:AraC-like DNA-binding protein
MEQFRLSRSVLARLEALDLPLGDILRQAQLPANLFEQEYIRLNLAQWFALWSAFAAQIDDPSIGLHISRWLPSAPYDPLWITALSANSFYGALGKVARYKRLFSAEEIQLSQQGDLWQIEVTWLIDQEPPALLLDATFAHMLELGLRGTTLAVYPQLVQFRRAEQHRAMYEQFFRCPIEFGAERNLIIFSDQQLQLAFKSANPDLLALIEPQLEAALPKQIAPHGFAQQVADLLYKRIAASSPSIQTIAKELHISPRTLQRRLAEQGVQFQQLLEQVRHSLAKRYLQASELDLTEIAFLLGYQEPASFHRAFMQWEGQPPGQWRSMQNLH